MDTSTLIGAIIGASSFGFISLVVLVVTCIGCAIKTRSKVSIRHLRTDQKNVAAIKVETCNSAYETPDSLDDHLYYEL